MAKSKQKYYVVWVGTVPGVYTSWEECKAQVHGFPKAKYKAYSTMEEATDAFHAGYQSPEPNKAKQKSRAKERLSLDELLTLPIDHHAIAVDAACSGNPGQMEYQGVYVLADEQMPPIFHFGPIPGTNNIAEFLAIVHALAWLKQKGDSHTVIYSDSRNAMLWVKNKKCKTTLAHTPRFSKAHEMIARAEKWLLQNEAPNKVLKWETKEWGQIPADFGRK